MERARVEGLISGACEDGDGAVLVRPPSDYGRTKMQSQR